MYADRFFKNVQSFFSFKKQRTEIAKNSFTFRFDGDSKQMVYWKVNFFLHEVSIAKSTRYTEWRNNHFTLIISEQEGRTHEHSLFSSSNITA